MGEKLKAAVVGCGGISNWHFGRVKAYDDVEYVGFYDIVKQKAEAMAAAKGEGKAFDCYVSMLDEGKPDILYVCVPPDQHGAIELEAIKRGIHMMIDKPIATEVAITEKICDLATQYNIIISVGFQDRYQDMIDEARKLLEGREIGLINAAWVGGIPGVYWWRRRTTSGGQNVEQHIHHFDLLRFLVGEPVSLYTAAGKGMIKPNAVNLPGYDVEDYSATAVTFRNGSVANIFTGDYIGEGGGSGMKNGITFFAKDATIDYMLRHKVVFTDKNGTKEILPKADSGQLLDRAFIDAVKSGKAEDLNKIRSPYFDAIKSLKFAVATNTSIDTGKAVYLNL